MTEVGAPSPKGARRPGAASTPGSRAGLLGLDSTRRLAERGEIDTVVVAMTDMQGRLQGKRFSAPHFLEEIAHFGTEACSYLLAADVEMSTVPGYDLTSWERGYGDFALVPDLESLRLAPWDQKSAICLADVRTLAGAEVEPSPRRVLQRQAARLSERGWRALAATELEFLVFRDTYEEAWANRYRNLTPANQYNVDYSVLGTGRVEPLLGLIREQMTGAGMRVESAKGECNLGQHEITFGYDDLVAKADEHVVFKTGAKQIASGEGCALTFMAKFDEREGNSCHLHVSLRDAEDRPVFASTQTERSGAGGDGATGTAAVALSETFSQFIAGLLATLGDLTLLLAPNVNSYKRFVASSFAPTTLAWGYDNRTCALRVVGHRPDSLRVECRVPGGDVNPYLALAAMVAGGLHGVEHGLDLEPAEAANAYVSGKARLPATLRDAMERFESSQVARDAFGDEVVEHYTQMARVEQDAFDCAVTDWERVRGFERL